MKLIPKFNNGGTYTIKSGDNLSTIAKKFNTSISKLLSLNPQIKDPDKIFIGQTLRLDSERRKPKAVKKRDTSRYRRDIAQYSDNTRVQTPQTVRIVKPLTGKDAVVAHKIRYDIDEPYWFLDKKSNKLYKMSKDKILNSYDVSLGWNKGDQYSLWQDTDPKDKWNSLSGTTGAGVYVVRNKNASQHYTEPEIVWFKTAETNIPVPTAIHAQSQMRLGRWNNGERRYSYGCISPEPYKMKQLYDNFNVGDTLYIDTESPQNALKERNGKIVAVFDKSYTTPVKTHSRWGKNYTTKARYNGIIE